jgi:hypothetical protein
MRKVIQIQVVRESFWQHGHIVALCDDGTMWLAVIDGELTKWRQIENPK